jgi:predicted ATPase/DNA-binding CsgD family transcriptional regulator
VPDGSVGVVTLLATAVDSSTLLWELRPDAVPAAVARHYGLVDFAVRGHGAVRWTRTGDGAGVLAEFRSSAHAVAAALAIQRELGAEEWPDGLPVRVRIGLCTGEVQGSDGRDLTAAIAHRCLRLRDIAHGGQTLLASGTASLVADSLPADAWLVDAGVHRLRDLSRPEHLFEFRHRELAHEFPPLRSLDVLPNNLPPQLTTFVGREDELAQIRRLIASHRLVTLVGPGGCGKTRLAVQVAADIADQWPDGVWWIDLGPVVDPALTAELTAATVGVLVEPVGGPTRALMSQLRRQHLMICLDTCEHVLDAVAKLAEVLLRSCPGVSVLATSREPLAVAGESVLRVPPLREGEAVRLFADRASLVRPAFRLAADRAAVQAICRRLDGIPLAIELAAAWARVLTPAQIAAGIDDLLEVAGGPRGATARHQTLAASMRWSHDLLGAADRVVFRRLSVFSGGFTLEAIRTVCADQIAGDFEAVTAAGRLVDKSLVLALEGGNEARYRMLDSIRQYAADRLEDAGETSAARDRHLSHFLALAELAEHSFDCDQDRWREALAAEHDNLRSALEWGLAAADPQHGLRLAISLARWWFLHGHTREGLEFLNRALERVSGDHPELQASLLSGLALVAFGAGQPALTAEAADRGLAVAVQRGDDRNRARCLVLSSYMPFFTDFRACRELCVQARQYGELAGDQFAVDFARLLEACVLTNRDQHGDAVALVQEFAGQCLARGERFCAAFGRAVEVWASLFTGDVRRARVLAVESVEIAKPLGDYFTIGLTTFNLAWVLGLGGDVDEGTRLMEPVVRSIESAGPDVKLLPWLALIPGKLHLWSGDFAAAVQSLELATQFAEPVTDNWVTVRALPGLASALRRLGRWDEARAQARRGIALGKKLQCPHALAEALEELAFGLAEEDPAAAEDLHHQALSVRVEHGLRTFYPDSLEALACLTARSESFHAAARLLAASDAARPVIGYPRPLINQSGFDAGLAAVRAGLDEADYAREWADGASLSLDDAVAYATRRRGTRGRAARGWASLTPTEREVVNLVVAGLTNPEIGARLFVSRATVKTHLVHVYAKLGVANRTELAALAVGRTGETA